MIARSGGRRNAAYSLVNSRAAVALGWARSARRRDM